MIDWYMTTVSPFCVYIRVNCGYTIRVKTPTSFIKDFNVYVLKKINVLMYMCSRRLYNVLPEVSGCPNLGSSYEDKKKKIKSHY